MLLIKRFANNAGADETCDTIQEVQFGKLSHDFQHKDCKVEIQCSLDKVIYQEGMLVCF